MFFVSHVLYSFFVVMTPFFLIFFNVLLLFFYYCYYIWVESGSSSSSSPRYWLQFGSPLTVGAVGMGRPVWGLTHQHSPLWPCRDILHWKRGVKNTIKFRQVCTSSSGGQRDANSMRSNWVCLAKSTCLRLYCPLLSQLGMWRAYRSSRGPRLSLKGILDILSRIWSSSCWHWVWTTKEKDGHSDRCG